MKCSQERCVRDAAPGRKKCEQHLEHDRVLAKARYAKRKAAGMCTVPGCRAKSDGEKMQCREHLLRTRQMNNSRRVYS